MSQRREEEEEVPRVYRDQKRCADVSYTITINQPHDRERARSPARRFQAQRRRCAAARRPCFWEQSVCEGRAQTAPGDVMSCRDSVTKSRGGKVEPAPWLVW